MNVREYIKSGVIESYVLGLATEAERQEFEQVCAAHPEVAEARDAFERSLEETLLQDAENGRVAPPAFIREKLLLQVSPPVVESSETKGVDETPIRRMNPWKWIAAASLLLLAGVGYWAYTTQQKYNDVVARQASMERQLQESTAQLQTLEHDAEILRHPMKPVALMGTNVAPQAQATVFWDTTGKKDVYMVINNLPQTPSDKQYQLWALLDGQPIDLGVFEVNQKPLVIKMKNVQKAQAFAITLERRGRPNQDKPEGAVYVVGKL